MSDFMDELAADLTEKFIAFYGEELGMQVYVNLMERLEEFRNDPDILQGTYRLSVFIREDDGAVDITKIPDDD